MGICFGSRKLFREPCQRSPSNSKTSVERCDTQPKQSTNESSRCERSFCLVGRGRGREGFSHSTYPATSPVE